VNNKKKQNIGKLGAHSTPSTYATTKPSTWCEIKRLKHLHRHKWTSIVRGDWLTLPRPD